METANRDDTARGNRASEDEIARLNEELRREHESLLRALADFDNFRRRVERDRLSMERAGIRAIVVKLHDVMDDFERALAHVDDGPPAIAQGLRTLQRKISGILEGQGVTPFSSLGEKFDPRIHEALGVVAQADLEPGTVAEELQRGYRWGEELLRPARDAKQDDASVQRYRDETKLVAEIRRLETFLAEVYATEFLTQEQIAETLKRTSLSAVAPGAGVNLERAVAMGGRLGGHIVQGHVDGVATLVRRTPAERSDELEFSLPPDLARYVVQKGSIAVDGVSLTVAGVTDDTFVVALIPTTLSHTTLGVRKPGDTVNIEVDLIAKYVEKLVVR